MKVFLGLYQGELETSKEKKSLDIAGKLKTAFEHYEDTFYGWYIPLESWMSDYDDTTTANLNNYYKELTAGLKSILPKKVLISPFIGAKILRTDPDKAKTKYTEILRDTGIDFLALQDGVGAGHINVSDPDLSEYFAAMCDACKANNIELWTNVESFKKVDEDGKVKRSAAEKARFIQQLDVAQRASRIVTFDFFHYMNINNILLGDDRPSHYEGEVRALNKGYRAWLAARQTSIESEPCVSLS